MKKLSFFTILALILFTYCSKENVKNGHINGKIMYAEGDCMPSTEPRTYNYNNYTGEIIFILETELDKASNTFSNDYDNIQNSSKSVFVNNGDLSATIPIGIYVVLPKGENPNDIYPKHSLITIADEQTISKDYKF